MDEASNIFDLGIDQWSVDERLRLMGEIWDSLSEHFDVPIPAEHQKALEQRIAEADANPDSLLPWATVRARLLERR